MNCRPILFSTPMVQAILDGRKTMTRQVIKPQPMIMANGKPLNGYNDSMIKAAGEFPVPKYQPGDVLYVREAWTRLIDVKGDLEYFYRADMENPTGHYKTAWHPSTHMPREAARLFLRVVSVRVERVQDILCGDMQREGCIPKTVTGGQWQQWQHDYWIPLWDSSAKRGYGWDSNPFCWVISFERVNKDEAMQ